MVAGLLGLLALSGLVLGASSSRSVIAVATVLAASVVAATAALQRPTPREQGHGVVWQQAAVARLGQRALEEPHLTTLLEEAVALVTSTLDVEGCSVFERLPDRSALRLRASVGRPIADAQQPAASQGLTTASTRIGQGDQVYGWLTVCAPRDRVFDPAERRFLDTTACILGLAIGRDWAAAAQRARQAELTQLAFHDPLTKLPNRTLFMDRLQHAFARAQRGMAPLSVLFVDLDDFKRINDSLGHAAGDQVLVEVAQRLAGCLRVGDTPARLGGDEFAVLLEDTPEPEAAQVVARINAALGAPITIQGQPITVGASIGMSGRTSQLAAPDQLLGCADAAMYAAKRQAKTLRANPRRG
jgi:diguanylate cyclase (GGDEF)-like protein